MVPSIYVCIRLCATQQMGQAAPPSQDHLSIHEQWAICRSVRVLVVGFCEKSLASASRDGVTPSSPTPTSTGQSLVGNRDMPPCGPTIWDLGSGWVWVGVELVG